MHMTVTRFVLFAAFLVFSLIFLPFIIPRVILNSNSDKRANQEPAIWIWISERSDRQFFLPYQQIYHANDKKIDRRTPLHLIKPLRLLLSRSHARTQSRARRLNWPRRRLGFDRRASPPLDPPPHAMRCDRCARDTIHPIESRALDRSRILFLLCCYKRRPGFVLRVPPVSIPFFHCGRLVIDRGRLGLGFMSTSGGGGWQWRCRS